MTRSTAPSVFVNLPPQWEGPPESALIAAARAALAEGSVLPDSGGAAGRGCAMEDAELSITLVAAQTMRSLNAQYHGVDQVTDVLAFGLDRHAVLGDIYICPEVAESSAHELGLDAGEEVLRLVIHGVLHLLGHDHPDGEARYSSSMFILQERLLAEVRRRA